MGVRSTYPLNTAESIEEALSSHIQGIEVDVRMTADGVLVAFHDEALKEGDACNGNVSELNAENVLACSTSTWLRSAPILTVEELLSNPKLKSLVVSLDAKLAYGTTKEVAAFADALKSLTAQFPDINFLIESNNIGFLQALQSRSVAADLFLNSSDAHQAVYTALENNLSGIVIEMNAISKEEIAYAQQQNLSVMIWGSGSVFSNRKAVQMQPDMIQTDDISSMMRILSKLR